METEMNEIDIEEHIDSNIVRKKNSNHSQRPKHKNRKILEYVPLLLCDVITATSDEYGIFKVFLGTECVYFRSCIFHVFVMAKMCENQSFNTYMMDDSTAATEMSIYRKQQELKSLARMQDECTVLGRTSEAQNRQELTASLLRLLSKTMEQLDVSRISVGSQLLVCAQPRFYRGKLKFNIYNFCKDNEISRDLEIGFKEYQINWYMQVKGKASNA